MKVAVILFFFFFFFFFVVVVSMFGELHLLSPFASSGSSSGSVVTASDGASGRHVTSSGDKRLNRKLLKEQVVVPEDYGLIDPNRKLLKEQDAVLEDYGLIDPTLVVLEDYGLIDPTPATKTSVGPKPIDHGSPLIPFIPQQPPQTPPPPTYDAFSPPTG